jgi:hypothetical protein
LEGYLKKYRMFVSKKRCFSILLSLRDRKKYSCKMFVFNPFYLFPLKQLSYRLFYAIQVRIGRDVVILSPFSGGFIRLLPPFTTPLKPARRAESRVERTPSTRLITFHRFGEANVARQPEVKAK